GLLATTASTTHPSAKAAYGMFHLRQTASTLAAWRAPEGEHRVALAGASPAAARLFEELRARQPLPGVEVLAAPAAGAAAPSIALSLGPAATVLVGPGEARAPEDVEVSPPLAAPAPAADSLCWPLPGGP